MGLIHPSPAASQYLIHPVQGAQAAQFRSNLSFFATPTWSIIFDSFCGITSSGAYHKGLASSDHPTLAHDWFIEQLRIFPHASDWICKTHMTYTILSQRFLKPNGGWKSCARVGWSEDANPLWYAPERLSRRSCSKIYWPCWCGKKMTIWSKLSCLRHLVTGWIKYWLAAGDGVLSH